MPRLFLLLLVSVAGRELAGQSNLQGVFEAADECTVTGWAYDPDQGYNPVRIRVFDGTTLLMEGRADLLRPDLPTSFLGRHHGFSLALPPLASGLRTLRVFAVEEDGSPRSLGQRTVTASYQSPGGRIETCSASAAEVVVAGWAFDGGAGILPIFVHLYVDGVYHSSQSANREMGASGAPLGSTQHGFRFTIPRPPPGIHVFEVYAINVGLGQTRKLPSLVQTTLDLRLDLAPLGARAGGAMTAEWRASDDSFRFRYEDGAETREYVLAPGDPALASGVLTVRESLSGAYPLFLGGTSRLSLQGELHVPENQLLLPGRSVVLLPCDFDGRELTLRYVETLEGATAGKTVRCFLRGKTLVLDIEAASSGPVPAPGSFAGFHPGRVVLQPARSFTVPYMPEPIVAGAGVFVTQIVDPLFSHGNAMQTTGPYVSGGAFPGIHHARFTRYLPDSAGRVESLRERVYLTVSSAIEDVFVSSSARPSPHRAVAGEFVIYDTWGVDRTPLRRHPWHIPFAEQASHFQTLKTEFGLDKVMVIRHNWGSHEDFAMPKLYPANVLAGGDSQLLLLSHLARNQGWRFALHENVACMFGPNAMAPAPPWYDPSAIARHADLSPRFLGGLQLGATMLPAYAVASARQPGYAALHAAYLRASYWNDAGFADVQPYLPPAMDLDAAKASDRTLSAAIRSIDEAHRILAATYGGPVSGESYGIAAPWSLVYAGHVTGLERELPGGEQGLVIPDYELRCVQPLQANQGMGYPSRFFTAETRQRPDFPRISDHDLIRSRTVAYGHTGFISDTLGVPPEGLTSIPSGAPSAPVFALEEILKEYYLLQALQARMLAGPVASITYRRQGDRTLSSIVQELVAASPDQASFSAAFQAFFRSPQLTITYQNGLVVHVNCHATDFWTVTANGETVILPPTGFYAIRTAGGDDFRAFMGLLPGHPLPFSGVRAPEYRFSEDRTLRLLTIWRSGVPILVPY
jgi:hypothetical protein